ncbi:MAG TPA: DNA mismatch repair endonuclease MutL [Acholeplasmataceae bacterium]|nr:DNA mismatch repair endonuclease MutL [Acholeplasmataceae bacterium]
MARIIKLDERLSNMIAAGEVVSRPASALKELIENAIDAEATAIEIYIKDYGLGEIKVIDNGVGMDKDDIHLAFFRHATSKIKNEYDLAHIKSLGFRGEAIPSIASVSKLTIKSKTKDSNGYQVTYHGGKLYSDGASALNEGTEVIIHDLFYNVPARLKYIKSPQTELAYIQEVVDEAMLSNPEVRFILTHEDKVLKQSFGDKSYPNLFAQIHGKEIGRTLEEATIIENDIKIDAYLASPTYNKAKKNDITILVNGRTIKNYLLINAVVEGYHTYIMVNRYPIAVIRITIDPSLIDVNVHPQKREIKLSNEYVIASMIRKLINQTLTKKPRIIEDVLRPTKSTTESYRQISGFEDVSLTIKEELPKSSENNHFNYKINDSQAEKNAINDPREQSLEFNDVKRGIPDFDYVGTYAGTYLLFQNKEGLFLVDQHAAAERIRYEIYYKKLGEPSQIRKQLLVPHLYDFRANEKNMIESNQSLFQKLGLQFESFGQNSYHLREVPIWLDEKDLDYMIYGMIEELERYQTIDISRLRDQLAKDISCKGAIKANKALNSDEIFHLMSELRNCDNPYFCPHGRPIIISFSLYEIEKKFKRIV